MHEPGCCPARFSAASQGALQDFPGQVSESLTKDSADHANTVESVAAGLGGALQTGGQWAHSLEIPGTPCLPRSDQQSPPGQAGERPGDLSLPGNGHGRAKTVYTLRRSVHPPLLAARAAQGVRQGALLWLLRTRLPPTPDCFAPTTPAEIPGELGGGISYTRTGRFNS